MMKKYNLVLLLLLPLSIGAQNINLQDLLSGLERTFPLVKQQDLLNTISFYQEENVSKMWWPQLSANAQATYQSAVTEVAIPNLSVPTLPKDQYKAYIDASQSIYDGGLSKAQKGMIKNNSQIALQKNAVEIYNKKQQLISSYLNILMTDRTLEIYTLSMQNLIAVEKKVDALYKNQYALKSDIAQIKAQQNNLAQKIIEARYNRKALIENLALLCKTELKEENIFSTPAINNADIELNRPEFKLFDFQKQQLTTQIQLTKASNRPKLALFAQGGYGRPALNMFSSTFDFYYIGGVRFTYPISNLYTYGNQLRISQNQSKIIETQKEVLTQAIQMQLNQTRNDRAKLQEQLTIDTKTIDLQEEILETAMVQYSAKSILLDDYTRKVNDLETARLTKSMHELQLKFTYLNEQFITGNL